MLVSICRPSAGIGPRSNFDSGKDRAFPSKQRCCVWWWWWGRHNERLGVSTPIRSMRTNVLTIRP